jgi:hypothetical protein
MKIVFEMHEEAIQQNIGANILRRGRMCENQALQLSASLEMTVAFF